MRNGMLVAALVLCTLAGVQILSQSGAPAFGQPAARPNGDPSILMANAPKADGGQQIVLVDTRGQVISSYHVDGETGEIALKSVRNFRWDLLMDDFNGGEPKPKEIRALLEQR